LNNFKRKRSISSQVATLLILMITAILIFVLVVTNIGQISNYATNLSNAVDAGSLYLASQIATKSFILSKALMDKCGNPEKCCKKRGLLSAILGIAFAIVGIFTFQPWLVSHGLSQFAATVVAGAIGGAVGGGIGGAIQGTGFLRGALQGAIIGAGIGGGAAAGFKYLPSIGLSSEAGAILGITLSAGASLYTAYVRDQMLQDAMNRFVKVLNGLPEKDSWREGVFLQVLSSTVDDPNKIQDEFDSDGDGDTQELVPYFQYWWDRHIDFLKGRLPSGLSVISRFLNNYFNPFYLDTKDFLKQMDRKEVECSCGSDSEGPLSELFRAIKGCGYDIFWKEGPDKDSLLSWYNQGCGKECPQPPSGFDDFDYQRMEYEEFINYAKAILKAYQKDPAELEADYSWISPLYDPDTNADFYDVFKEIIMTNMQKQANEIVGVRDMLPGCQLVYGDKDKEIYNNQLTTPYSCNEEGLAINNEDLTIKDKNLAIYPCNWEKQKESLSIYFPNPLCKLYDLDKQTLINEINIVKDFVKKLKEKIKNEIAENPPSCEEDCSLVSIDYNSIEIKEICLSGNIHSHCSKEGLGQGMATIKYSYTYNYSCKCCVADDCCSTEKCNCDQNGQNCSSCCVADPCCTTETSVHQGSGSGSEQISSPDLDIPCMDENSFLDVLDEFQRIISELNDKFATIDEDFDDEFDPVLRALNREILRINSFLRGVDEFYRDIQRIERIRREDIAINPLTYSWHDSRCPTNDKCHSVEVYVGDFNMPSLERRKYGNWLIGKVCIELDYHTQDVEVRVTRQDPSGISLGAGSVRGILGAWNPFSGRIFRRSIARYRGLADGSGYVKIVGR
jgi:hypothetical protein